MAILAASTNTDLERVSTTMVQIDRTLETRTEARDPHDEGYLRLFDELVR